MNVLLSYFKMTTRGFICLLKDLHYFVNYFTIFRLKYWFFFVKIS